MLFWREKEKNCASRFEGKKAVMPWEMRDCPWRAATPRGTTTVPERAIVACTVLFWLFRRINGDKVATDHTSFLIS
jgi:hypothetical protein